MHMHLPPPPPPAGATSGAGGGQPVRREAGPIISVWLGSTLNVVVSNSELAKQVLKEIREEETTAMIHSIYNHSTAPGICVSPNEYNRLSEIVQMS